MENGDAANDWHVSQINSKVSSRWRGQERNEGKGRRMRLMGSVRMKLTIVQCKVVDSLCT
jgi:hypothetical protein